MQLNCCMINGHQETSNDEKENILGGKERWSARESDLLLTVEYSSFVNKHDVANADIVMISR